MIHFSKKSFYPNFIPSVSKAFCQNFYSKRYIFLRSSVSLDTFHKVVQNIDNRLHAWLTFLSSDEPADIMNLITLYPEFGELYKEIAEFRKNPKELIYMYSEALAIMDRNTIQLTLEAELSETKEQLAYAKDQLSDSQALNAKQAAELASKEAEIANLKEELRKVKGE